MLPTENFLIGDENPMDTLRLKLIIVKILLFYTRHRVISFIGLALLAFWCTYLLVMLIPNPFWCTPIVVTEIVIFLSLLVATLVMADDEELWESFVEKVQSAYDELLPNKDVE